MSERLKKLNELEKKMAGSAPEVRKEYRPIGALPGGAQTARAAEEAKISKLAQLLRESSDEGAIIKHQEQIHVTSPTVTIGGLREARERIAGVREKEKTTRETTSKANPQKVSLSELLHGKKINEIEPASTFLPSEKAESRRQIEFTLRSLHKEAAHGNQDDLVRRIHIFGEKFGSGSYDISEKEIKEVCGACSLSFEFVAGMARRAIIEGLNPLLNKSEYDYLFKKDNEKDRKGKSRTDLLVEIVNLARIRNHLISLDKDKGLSELNWEEVKSLYSPLLHSLKGIRSTPVLASGRILKAEGIELLVNEIKEGRLKEPLMALAIYDSLIDAAVLDEEKVKNWLKKIPAQKNKAPEERGNWTESRYAAAEILQDVAIMATKAIALYVAPEIEWKEGNFFNNKEGREFLLENEKRFVERLTKAKPEKYYLKRLVEVEKEIEEGDEISFSSMWEVIRMADCSFRSVAPKADEISEKYFIKTIRKALEEGDLCIEDVHDKDERREIKVKAETLVELLTEMCRPRPQSGLELEKAAWELACIYGLEDSKRYVQGSIATKKDIDDLVANKERIVENIIKRRSKEDYAGRLEKAISALDETGENFLDNIRIVRESMNCFFTDVAKKADEYSTEYILPYIEESFREGAFYKKEADARTLVELMTDLAVVRIEGGIEQEKKAWKFICDNILVFRFPPNFIKDEVMSEEWRRYVLDNIDWFVECVSNYDAQTIRRIAAIKTEIKAGNLSSSRELYQLCSDGNRITAQRATYVFNLHAIPLLEARLNSDDYDLLLDASLLTEADPVIFGQREIKTRATKIIYEAFAKQSVPECAVMDEEGARYFKENKARYFKAASSALEIASN